MSMDSIVKIELSSMLSALGNFCFGIDLCDTLFLQCASA